MAAFPTGFSEISEPLFCDIPFVILNVWYGGRRSGERGAAGSEVWSECNPVYDSGCGEVVARFRR